MSLTLRFSHGSPFARRVRILLLEKHIPFTPDIRGALGPIEAIQPENPLLQVPVLTHNEQRLFGTALIIDYLTETFPHTPPQPIPLAPTLTRAAQHWQDRLTLTAIEQLTDTIVNIRLLTADGPLHAPYLDRQHQRITSILDWLEPRATATGFWPGTFSMMDIGLLAALGFAQKRGMLEITQARHPSIAALLDHWSTRPSVVATRVDVLPAGG